MALVPWPESKAENTEQLAVFEGALPDLGKLLEPTIQQLEKAVKDAYQFGVELCEGTYRWITGEQEEDEDELPTTSVQLASREIAYFSGFSSVCTLLPSSTSSVVMASVNIGPFGFWTFALSGMAACFFVVQSVRTWNMNSEENGRRNVYRGAATAFGIAAAGQVAFLALNHTAVVGMHVLPFVTVSSFFAPMMNPFLVLHLFAFSTELPFVFYVQGRMAGVDANEMNYCHLNAGLFGVLSILSASTKNVWLRLALLAASGLCTYKLGQELQRLPDKVKEITVSRMAKMWEKNLNTSISWAGNVAIFHVGVQALGAGYLGLMPQAYQIAFLTMAEGLMLHVCFRKILYDHNHVARAEMRLIEKEAGERRQAQVRAG